MSVPHDILNARMDWRSLFVYDPVTRLVRVQAGDRAALAQEVAARRFAYRRWLGWPRCGG